MQGLGDAIAKVTEAIGIEKCEGCNKRQTKLNKMFPFKNASELTAFEMEFLTDVFTWYKGLPIQSNKAKELQRCEDIWIRAFNIKTLPCRTCGTSHQNNYMNDLKKLWENQKH